MIARMLLIAAALTTFASPAVASAALQSAAMPPFATVEPEGKGRNIVVAPDGTVYALAVIPPDGASFVLRWRPGGAAERIDAADIKDRQGMRGAVPSWLSLRGDQLYVTAAQVHDGAYIGAYYQAQLLAGGRLRPLQLPACVHARWADPHVLAAGADGTLAVTLDPSANGAGFDLADDASRSESLPTAMLVVHGRCRPFGHVLLTAIRGDVVAGYRSVLDGKPAPWFINRMVQYRTGLRWEHGLVGSTALSGHAKEWVDGNFLGPPGHYTFPVPHAVRWDRRGRATLLLAGDARSVAYDEAADGTVAGMLVGRDGRHYAFVRAPGRGPIRLDDAVHVAGWRFESAFAIDDHHRVSGVGTYQGLPRLFRIDVPRT